MATSKTCPVCGGAYPADNLFCPLDRALLVSVDEASSLLGTVVAERYLLSDLIGSGGMGDVYRAQDVRLQRPAAVKLLRTSLSADLDALRRFSREGMNASRINSPHVVQVYDAGETSSGLPYLAMEFVPGRSLGRVLADEGPLEPSRAVELIKQIAIGLDAAHRIGVVHRDLKPDNILITDDAVEGETAKVADFGISRAVRDETQKVTRTGLIAGTCEFMSPEQALGGELDHRSDLYSLGLIAFLMLTGKLPFAGASAEHSRLMRLSEPPTPLSAVTPGRRWASEVQVVFDRALAREPSQRFSSAEEFAAALDGAMRTPGRTPSARARFEPPEPAAASAPSSKRGWTPLLTAVAGVLLAVGLVGAIVHLAPAIFDRFAVDDGGRAGSGETAEGGPRDPNADGANSTPGPIPSPSIDTTTQDGVPPAVDLPDTTDSLQPAQPNGGARPKTKAHPHPAPRPTSPVPPSPLKPPPVPDARGLLDPFDDILHQDMPPDSARAALAVLDSLMPRLRTMHDSIDADLYRAEALAILGRDESACRVLSDAWPRATDLQRQKIGLWQQQGLCPHAEWRQS